MSSIIASLRSLVSSIIGLFASVIETVVGIFTSIVGAIVSGIEAVFGLFGTLGKDAFDLVSGLVGFLLGKSCGSSEWGERKLIVGSREYRHHRGAGRGVCGVYDVSAAAGEECEWEEDGLSKGGASVCGGAGTMGRGTRRMWVCVEGGCTALLLRRNSLPLL